MNKNDLISLIYESRSWFVKTERKNRTRCMDCRLRGNDRGNLMNVGLKTLYPTTIQRTKLPTLQGNIQDDFSGCRHRERITQCQMNHRTQARHTSAVPKSAATTQKKTERNPLPREKFRTNF
ncbi:hypothetical protein [Photobacterium arenosum]|uniref:hypothetical protein n=1 Tax=Photobacterium arenosum TaxID=2774143 RepID=UPI00288A2087|nr:hypothetical protein [Photobacterium arenosum]